MGRRAVRDVLAVGVPALPARLQAHRPVGAHRSGRQWRQRTTRRRDLLPGHVHSRRAPGACILRIRRPMMKSLLSIVTVLVVVGAGLVNGTAAADKVRVVTTIPDLKSLTQAVGGELVDVESLTRGTQNFHEVEVRP